MSSQPGTRARAERESVFSIETVPTGGVAGQSGAKQPIRVEASLELVKPISSQFHPNDVHILHTRIQLGGDEDLEAHTFSIVQGYGPHGDIAALACSSALPDAIHSAFVAGCAGSGATASPVHSGHLNARVKDEDVAAAFTAAFRHLDRIVSAPLRDLPYGAHSAVGLTVVIILGGWVHVASVGKSRCIRTCGEACVEAADEATQAGLHRARTVSFGALRHWAINTADDPAPELPGVSLAARRTAVPPQGLIERAPRSRSRVETAPALLPVIAQRGVSSVSSRGGPMRLEAKRAVTAHPVNAPAAAESAAGRDTAHPAKLVHRASAADAVATAGKSVERRAAHSAVVALSSPAAAARATGHLPMPARSVSSIGLDGIPLSPTDDVTPPESSLSSATIRGNAKAALLRASSGAQLRRLGAPVGRSSPGNAQGRDVSARRRPAAPWRPPLVLPMTTDCDLSNKEERTRLVRAGAILSLHKRKVGAARRPDVVKRAHWLGTTLADGFPGLAVTRCVGASEGRRWGVLPDPIVKSHELSQRGEWIVAASDSVWAAMTPEEVAHAVLEAPGPSRVGRAAKTLVARTRGRQLRLPEIEDHVGSVAAVVLRVGAAADEDADLPDEGTPEHAQALAELQLRLWGRVRAAFPAPSRLAPPARAARHLSGAHAAAPTAPLARQRSVSAVELSERGEA